MAMVASPHHQVRKRVRAWLLECEREKDREEKAAAAAGGRRDRDDDDAALPKEAPPSSLSRPSRHPRFPSRLCSSLLARAHALRLELVYELACERKAAPGRGRNEQKTLG